MSIKELGQASLADTTRFEMTHRPSGDRFVVTVAVLDGGAPGPHPAVYVSDANVMFASVLQLAGIQRLMGELPPLVLVGVGYPFTDLFSDQTATAEWVRLRQEHSCPSTVLGARGRVLDLLDFYENDLIPFVEARFPVSNERTVLGGSATGAFALQAWLMRPRLFTHCAALAPAIMSRDPKSPFERFEPVITSLETDFLASRAPHARLFQSYGTKDTRVNVEASQRLHERMLAAGVDSTLVMLDGETHATSWAAGAARALRTLTRPPSATA